MFSPEIREKKKKKHSISMKYIFRTRQLNVKPNKQHHSFLSIFRSQVPTCRTILTIKSCIWHFVPICFCLCYFYFHVDVVFYSLPFWFFNFIHWKMWCMRDRSYIFYVVYTNLSMHCMACNVLVLTVKIKVCVPNCSFSLFFDYLFLSFFLFV